MPTTSANQSTDTSPQQRVMPSASEAVNPGSAAGHLRHSPTDAYAHSKWWVR